MQVQVNCSETHSNLLAKYIYMCAELQSDNRLNLPGVRGCGTASLVNLKLPKQTQNGNVRLLCKLGV